MEAAPLLNPQAGIAAQKERAAAPENQGDSGETSVISAPGQEAGFSRLLIDEIDEGVAAIAADGTVLYCNHRLAEMLGVSDSMIVGNPILRYVVNSDHSIMRTLIDGASGEKLTAQLTLRVADGPSMPATASVKKIEVSGKPVLCLALADLTEERKRDELLTAGEVANTIFDQAAEAIVVCDQQGRVVRANPRAHHLYGGNLLRTSFLTAFPLLHGDPRRLFSLDPVLAGETLHGIKASFINCRAESVDVVCSASPITDSTNSTLRCVVTLTDIRESKRTKEALVHAERSLRQADEQLGAIIDHAPIAISAWERGRGGAFRGALWSPTAAQLFGVGPELIVGQHLSADPSDPGKDRLKVLADLYLPDLSTASMSKELRLTESCVEFPDGQHYLETTFVPLKSAGITRVIAWTIDVTERRLVKDALQQHSEQLENEVARRTAELEDLSDHLQKVAENERTLIARELHDELGGTLSSVKVAQGMLASSLAGVPGVPERLEQIQHMVDRALDATRHLIRQLRPPVLDHFGLVAALEWQAKEFSCSSGIPCHLQVPQNEPGGEPGGDLNLGEERSTALFRIFQEALTNVAKHAHATEVVASLEAIDGVIVLRIADNGTGLASNPNAKVAGAGGFGIRGMIERARHLGGSLSLTSEPGKGTVAVARIPLSRRSRRIRVLVVDDHAVVRHGLRSFLESATDDMSVTGETADGEEAVGMALSGNFDVVLMDISMPKLNGLRALGQIKARMFDLPVLIVSTHPADVYAPRILELGADGYVNKEQITEDLIRTIRKVLPGPR